MATVLGNQAGQPKLDLSQAKDLNCIHCNYPYFIQAVMVKKFSRFITNTPNDAVIPVDVLLCGNCGKPMEDLLPKEFRKHTHPSPEQQEQMREQFPANVEGSAEFNKANANSETTISPAPSKIILEP
jgi:hypothetical protein